VNLDNVPVLPVFKWLATAGSVSPHEMLRTFNCGIGMVAVLDPAAADAASERFTANGETVVRLVKSPHRAARLASTFVAPRSILVRRMGKKRLPCSSPVADRTCALIEAAKASAIGGD